MGCGKSTIGPLVSREIGFRFVDLDDEIEQQSGRTVAALFNERGESGFREIEMRELRRVAELRDVVVACGGGVVTVAENRRILAERGLSVYLRVAPDELARRLQTSTDRPMLYGEDGGRLPRERLEARIESLLAEREGYYEKADVVLDVTGLSVETAAAAIVEAIASS